MKKLLDEIFLYYVIFIFFALGMGLLSNNKKLENCAIIDAKIVEIGTCCYFNGKLKTMAYVDYTYNGMTYSCERLNDYNSLMRVGDIVRIGIDKETKEICYMGNDLFLGILFIVPSICGMFIIPFLAKKETNLVERG